MPTRQAPSRSAPLERCTALLLLAVTCGLPACATTGEPIDTRPAIDLALRTAEGEPTSLAAMRGGPVLLLLFATYDSTSQLAWGPLLMTLEDFPDVQVMGIALGPDAGRLLPLYGESLGLTGRLAFEVEPAIVSGQSPLGPIGGIPHYVLLDEEGRILGQRTGIAPASDLRDWLTDNL